MSPLHHPSPERLVQFAAGALDRSQGLVLESHRRACEICRRETTLAEAVGGALLETLEPEALRPDALDRALARIELPSPARGVENLAAPSDWITVPREVLAGAARRRRWAAPRVWVAPVRGERAGTRSYLLRVGAGMSVPRHTHRGVEMVCLIKGAFVDRGIVYRQGDFIESDDRVDHRPTITGDGECICLVAADGALVPRDWIGRLFQPLVGI